MEAGMRLTFGAFNGRELSDPAIPDSYIQWLASRGKYYKSKHSPDPTWKVPTLVWLAALTEIERRGYRIIGERFEKD
jgi:hypothetical protein